MNGLMFRALKEILRKEWEKYTDKTETYLDFWDWVAQEYPDTYDVCLSLTNNQLYIRE